MVAIVSSNNLSARDSRAPAPAVREDGSNYPWRMFFESNQRIVDADTTGEVLDFLIPYYTFLTPEEQAAARLTLAQQVQQLARASILANITAEQAENISDEEWEILNYGEGVTTEPYGWGDGTGALGFQDPEVADQWNCATPLVLIDTNYVPHTDILPPLSSEGDFAEVKNIIWLRPEWEEAFLTSLSRIGFITFGVAAAASQ